MISDSGKYSGFGYPDIQIPVEITTYSTNAYISPGEFMRDFGTCVFLASVASPPQLLTGFARAVRYTNLYLACI